MRPLTAALILLGLLPAAAHAKGLDSAEVCGASSCRTIRDARKLEALFGGGRQVNPPRPAPFYVLEMRILRGPGSVDAGPVLTYVPAARALRRASVRGRALWQRLDPEQLNLYREVTEGLLPLPAHLVDRAQRLPDAAGRVGPPESRTVPVLATGTWPITGIASGAAAVAMIFALRRRRRTQRPVLFNDA